MNKIKYVQDLLKKADIKIGGDRPQDIHIYNDRFYAEAFRGTIGIGESYMRGEWNSNDFEETVFRFYTSKIEESFKPNLVSLYSILKSYLINPQTPFKSLQQIKSHFDIDPKMYQSMLGQTMAYTCGYWHDKNMSLDEAQEAKLELICNKILLKNTDHVLDIGCGWGSFAYHANRKHGCRVTGITISNNQFQYCKKKGIPKNDSPRFFLADYRSPEKYNPDQVQYDKAVAIGVMEHIGVKNIDAFFETAYDQLKDGGLFLLHTIGSNYRHLNSDKWIDKYIFPGGELVTVDQIALSASNHCKFNLEHFENFGPFYSDTLRAWFHNFDGYWKSSEYATADEHQSFYRMWKFYLLSCAAAFRAKRLNLWHFVFSKNYPDHYPFPQSYIKR